MLAEIRARHEAAARIGVTMGRAHEDRFALLELVDRLLARVKWIQSADRLPIATDHPGGATRKDPWGREVPIDHVPCLAVLRSRPRGVALLQWNLHHLCWDDDSGDDHCCAAGDVLCWMPAPAPPAEAGASALTTKDSDGR